MIFDGLNPEQRRAVEAVRGPVCILAGAGSGKTTTVTRRIANQVATGAFAPHEILAVTFTDKAAGEMRARLAALGATGVRASTFHSAALAQLRHFAPDTVGKILSSKALSLRHIANSLPRAFRFRPAGDLATEIEWAKNRRVPPEGYLAAVGERKPPIPADLMAKVYAQYESRKGDQGYTDFEDLLELTIRLFDGDPAACELFSERYRAFTVDEYQDVNLLQQELLDRWLGGRDDLCVVGDDYQSIYAFTGATPAHLLGVPERFPHAVVVRLEENYRSTPQVLELANRLVPSLGGAEKVLRATLPDGPEPLVRPFATAEAEAAFVVEHARALAREGTPFEEMAVLSRTNARLADFEEALHGAGIPTQGAALLTRDAGRSLVRKLGGSSSPEVAHEVRAAAESLGWLASPPDGLGEREQTRQSDLSRIVNLASTFEGTVAEFLAELERRFGRAGGEGVNLLTLHGAKGLEFDAVFVSRVEEGELPIRQAKSDEAVAEERRLLYVGLTRARRELAVTWVKKPSRFLSELGVAARAAEKPKESELSPAARALKAWRLERARADEVPAYVVFPDRTLHEIVARRPATPAELAAIPGLGPARLEKYGRELWTAVREALELPDDAPAPPPAAPRVADGLYHSLAVWRRTRAARDDVPPYVVFDNKTLDAIARAKPASADELAALPGVGPVKLDRYADEVLAVVASGEQQVEHDVRVAANA